ncbi:hypothetical protein Snov_0142 [Ancylobacter novellus DSM 506]|uniref:Spy/CpxP family protein refolding chaperone n=1 Tax=Ancylobacter novellus (strain ATCC 8093 / DSM 506 / JCM 20403 / CCM 1077 / IAM 12100 / NBRC 12443 / NCIMB 10456) TaxID=639283 RepID=D7A0W9_ANCN5|nr:hypothetical protein [Ancylobacter novellus]ADH87479.1 hypothetical protein Snov_0142 [Ancylobacter novellus DSM 506]
MRKIFPSTLSTRIAGGAVVLALVAAGAVPTLGIAQDLAGPLAAPAGAAGPWACEVPPFAAGPGPAIDPAAARLIAGMLLSAQETALGIRTDQMDAWRGYTTALIALLPSGERLGRWTDEKKRAEAQAFDLAQDIAGAAIERAEKARALQDAVSKLKTVLTPEQMSMAKQMQEKLVERIVRFVQWRRGEGSGVPL